MRYKLQKLLLILVSSSFFCFGCTYIAEVKSELPQNVQRHVLERLSFGVNSEQISQVKNQGIEAYIQSQLNPSVIPESTDLKKYIEKTISISKRPLQAHQKLFASSKKLKNNQLSVNQQIKIKTARNDMLLAARQEAIDVHIARGIYSNRQLQEVMADFWFNHFNIFVAKDSVGL